MQEVHTVQQTHLNRSLYLYSQRRQYILCLNNYNIDNRVIFIILIHVGGTEIDFIGGLSAAVFLLPCKEWQI